MQPILCNSIVNLFLTPLIVNLYILLTSLSQHLYTHDSIQITPNDYVKAKTNNNMYFNSNFSYLGYIAIDIAFLYTHVSLLTHFFMAIIIVLHDVYIWCMKVRSCVTMCTDLHSCLCTWYKAGISCTVCSVACVLRINCQSVHPAACKELNPLYSKEINAVDIILVLHN